MALLGEFDEVNESWPLYAKWLKHFLKTNEVTNEEQMMSMFLSVIGSDTFKLLESLLSLVNLKDNTIILLNW